MRLSSLVMSKFNNMDTLSDIEEINYFSCFDLYDGLAFQTLLMHASQNALILSTFPIYNYLTLLNYLFLWLKAHHPTPWLFFHFIVTLTHYSTSANNLALVELSL